MTYIVTSLLKPQKTLLIDYMISAIELQDNDTLSCSKNATFLLCAGYTYKHLNVLKKCHLHINLMK